MSTPLDQAVHAALATVIDPELRRPITELGMVESVDICRRRTGYALAVLLTIAGCPLRGTITADCRGGAVRRAGRHRRRGRAEGHDARSSAMP